MKNKSPDQPISESYTEYLAESRARLQRMEELICHLLWRNHQLRMELLCPSLELYSVQETKSLDSRQQALQK